MAVRDRLLLRKGWQIGESAVIWFDRPSPKAQSLSIGVARVSRMGNLECIGLCGGFIGLLEGAKCNPVMCRGSFRRIEIVGCVKALNYQ